MITLKNWEWRTDKINGEKNPINFDSFEEKRRLISLILGPFIFFLILLIPASLPPQAQRQIAVMVFVFIWWIGEAIPLGITACLVPVLSFFLGLCDLKEGFKNFSHPVIFLFLGSFIIAEAMIQHKVDLWFAKKLLQLKVVKTSPSFAIFLFGFFTFFISMWMSNTAATAITIPLLLSLFKDYSQSPEKKKLLTGGALFVAYSASIGGIVTPVGTPPNIITLGYLKEMAQVHISFLRWIVLMSLPCLSLFCIVFLLIYSRYIRGNVFVKVSSDSKNETPSLTFPQKIVLMSFCITVILWLLPGLFTVFLGESSAIALFLRRHLPEEIPALIGAIIIFLIPSKFKPLQPTIDLSLLKRIDWNTILLFGGGLTLGELTLKTGVGKIIGSTLYNTVNNLTFTGTIALVIFLSVGFTEFASNTATANLFIPLIISTLKDSAYPLLPPVLASCISSSLAFLFPISTPPNAIAYGSGFVPIKEMIKTGIFCDLSGFIIMIIYFFFLHLWGIF